MIILRSEVNGVAENQVVEDEEQLVIFDLANEQYGVDIASVYEIIRPQDITRVPQTPQYVEGVINLRGQVIPVIDLRRRMGLPAEGRGRSSRIVVVKIDDQTIGMSVDGVSEVLRIPPAVIEPPSPIVTGVDSDYLRGIAKMEDKLIILLSLEKVVTKADTQAIAMAE